uniref:Glycoside hydrolase family 65 central catalytic n=1 Tax=Bacillus selenitireducens (strain ATCC 700615 / DSM 15326 / MLS10) TaxID=439292 RepID=UPI00045EDE9E|nr:Chain A, Glycoside hydrolase family 65 central catalytic [[Bacillus] selenitireducens MLS10]4KTP_B Chain B, Glycoside hydrolase family 65 central catalytic [[Bacillus] selenitireducens MLS10]
MHEIGEHLTTNTGWDIIKNRYEAAQAITEGSNFMIGNGFMGYRGTFAEDGKDAYAACIVTDTWDKADGKWEELSTVPNALLTLLHVDGEPFIMSEEAASFERTLDLSQGVTSRKVSQRMKNGATITIHEEKFASYRKKHAVLMKYTVESDQDTDAVLDTGIDYDVWSINGDHLQGHHYFSHPTGDGVTAKTVSYEDTVTVVETCSLDADASEEDYQNPDGSGRTFPLSLEAGKPVTLEKAMIIYSSNDVDNPQDEALLEAKHMQSYEEEKAANRLEWDNLWSHYDVTIQNNIIDQVALRFNIYHAIIATPVHKSLPIGARGLSCQAYQGAAFWDQEIYNMPMYLYSNPEIARNILKYRHRTLDGARRKAKRLGYEGAYYAWISGKTGDELCPDFFFKDVLSGRDIRNHFNDWQIHISPDIAYAVKKYHQVTGDDAFIRDYGAEMIFEIARFLASHAVYKPMRGRYEFMRVQGPDEYHENVDNNAFTNHQAMFTLQAADELLQTLDEKTLSAVKEKIGLSDDEISLWRDMLANTYVPKPDKHGIIEQFDGYYDLETIIPAKKVTERLIKEDEYYGYPNGVTVRTQCIKQADVIQLFVLHPHLYDRKTVELNYEFYEPRTLHFSSLSPSSYAIVAAQIDKVEEAYRNFRKSVMIDLLNTNEAVSGGTFIGGIHTAANGASWQMVVNGFGGLSVHGDDIHLSPRLPDAWDGYTFKAIVKGQTLEVDVTKEQITITNKSEDRKPLTLHIFGEKSVLDSERITKSRLEHHHHHH